MADDDRVVIEHPNRRKASSQFVRLVVIVLLLVSATVVVIVALGGWEALEGAKPVLIAFIVVYFVFALFVARWSRGVLPLVAGLAIVLGIFAAIAAPAWFDRTRDGFTDPGLSSDVLGLVCGLLVLVQAALIVISLQGFRQAWNVEVERAAPAREPATA